MIGLALSGGGSRAIAFHLGCLRALHDLDVLNDVKVLSSISGGSVIGAYYAYSPEKSFEDFEKEIKVILKKGFQLKTFMEMLKPQRLAPVLASFTLSCIQEPFALFTKNDWLLPRFQSRTDMLRYVFSNELFKDLMISSPRRNNMEVVIGACELRTGTAFRFGNLCSGNGRFGEIEHNDIDLAFAVAASAAHPVLLPAFDKSLSFEKQGRKSKHRVILTDGGVYDNLGVQVLEPDRDPKFSLHAYSCDYVIACNASEGTASGDGIPMGFPSRVKRSFEVVHRRVQDVTMGRLHTFKERGLLKGFVLPYLGQRDQSLPIRPSNLIPREEVITYPTDFCAMSEEWIDKLSGRGEQLTRALISYYIPELIS